MNSNFVLGFHFEDLLTIGMNPLLVIILLLLSIIIPLVIVRICFWRRTYICSECNNRFRPKFTKVFVGWHDGIRKDQYCPYCKTITLCKKDEEK